MNKLARNSVFIKVIDDKLKGILESQTTRNDMITINGNVTNGTQMIQENFEQVAGLMRKG
jgi:hypothetical protein